MDITRRVQELMQERNWSEYRLAKTAGLSKSTISAMLQRNTIPSLSSLKAICDAFGITFAQFFAEEGQSMLIAEEQRILLEHYAMLSGSQKELIQKTMEEFLKTERSGC